MPVYGLGVIERMVLGAVCPRQDMNPASRYPLAPFKGVWSSRGCMESSSLDGVTLITVNPRSSHGRCICAGRANFLLA
jgi:hypothetical protein